MYELPDIASIVATALAEDLGVDSTRLTDESTAGLDLLGRDVTSASVIGFDAQFLGTITARAECVVCGLPVANAVFETISRAAGLFDPVEVYPLVAEGTRVAAGTAVAEIEGLAAAVLTGERTALDFLMVLSGIATETSRWVAAAGDDLAVCDTRKTIPGLRALSKYAVRVGGGTNHRTGLFDMVLVKDNHIARQPSITQAVRLARASHPDLMVEVGRTLSNRRSRQPRRAPTSCSSTTWTTTLWPML
jgi:nicotinate-nucleotide pyrophosphorylase (carboxylating)